MDNPVTPELIAGLYQGALEPARWQATLAAICDAFHADGCNLWTADLATGAAVFDNQAGRLAGHYGYDDASVASYINYYSQSDVWSARTAAMLPGDACTGSALFPPEQLLRTEWYAAWLRPLDLFHAVGGCVQRAGSETNLFSLLRARRAGDFTSQEVSSLRQLLPHMTNASRLYREMWEREQASAGALEALEALPEGVLLFGRDGRLLHATRRARQLLCDAPGLRLGAAALELEGGGSQVCALQALLRAALACGNGAGASPGGEVSLHTLAGPLHCRVTPLPAGAGGLASVAGAALFCSMPLAAPTMADSLRQRFRMTPAEALLTEALVNGRTLKEHAAQRDVSVNTVRSQLKGAVAKAGARRQSDLVRIVLTSPASAATSATPARH